MRRGGDAAKDRNAIIVVAAARLDVGRRELDMHGLHRAIHDLAAAPPLPVFSAFFVPFFASLVPITRLSVPIFALPVPFLQLPVPFEWPSSTRPVR